MRIKKAMGFLTPPVVLPYRGYGNPHEVHINGHVLDDRRIYEADENDRRRRNIKAMISRYMADALAGVRVRISFQGEEKVVETNDNGYFEALFTFDDPIPAGWHGAAYEVLDKLVENQKSQEYHNDILIIDHQPRFGIISDIDDTILVSHATRIRRKLSLILTKNAKTRMPFKGVAEFYKALHFDNSEPLNPVFYVSSSEWNLYDFLEDFCDTQGLPKGIFMLQDLKRNIFSLLKSGGGTHRHKFVKVSKIMSTFNDLQVVLVGDSGQKDAQIYTEIIEKFPGRVISVYIRDVNNQAKDMHIRKLSDHLMKSGVEMLLVKDTAEAAGHAFEKGLITEEERQGVQAAVASEE